MDSMPLPFKKMVQNLPTSKRTWKIPSLAGQSGTQLKLMGSISKEKEKMRYWITLYHRGCWSSLQFVSSSGLSEACRGKME